MIRHWSNYGHRQGYVAQKTRKNVENMSQQSKKLSDTVLFISIFYAGVGYLAANVISPKLTVSHTADRADQRQN